MTKQPPISDIRKRLSELLKEVIEYEAVSANKIDDAKSFESRLKKAISEATLIPWDEIIKKGGGAERVTGRQLYSYFLKTYTNMTYRGIAVAFGLDHSSVVAHINKAKDYMLTNDCIFMTPFNVVYDKLFVHED